MAKFRQHCPGFKKTMVGDVLLDLVPSTGNISLLQTGAIVKTKCSLNDIWRRLVINDIQVWETDKKYTVVPLWSRIL